MMTAANEYGKALFLITEEDGVTEKVLSDVKMAERIFKSNPDYVKLLCSPAVPKEERVELADKALSELDWRLLNLIKILVENREVSVFDKVAKVYSDLYDESRGIVRVDAVTAIPLTEKQTAALTAKLAATLNATVIITNLVDKSILGGMKLRYSGVQLDGSVKTRLDKFEDALKSTVI